MFSPSIPASSVSSPFTVVCSPFQLNPSDSFFFFFCQREFVSRSLLLHDAHLEPPFRSTKISWYLFRFLLSSCSFWTIVGEWSVQKNNNCVQGSCGRPHPHWQGRGDYVRDPCVACRNAANPYFFLSVPSCDCERNFLPLRSPWY